MPRRIISDLAAMPVEQIKSELEDLQAEKTKLEMEEQLLSQMLRLRQWEAKGVPGAAETIDATKAVASERKRGNVSANALAIVRQADEPLLPSDVRDRLMSDGVVAGMEAIRVALRRWVDRGELQKQGRYYVEATADSLLSPNGGDPEE